MKDKILQFLDVYCSQGTLLLGLSGGPDSMALFHLLLAVDCPFMVAHVDHGWRNESQKEATILENLCGKYQIPYFLKRLKRPEGQKNLEEACRKKRLDFFKDLVKKNDLEGVLLAHHAGDQAETVLKRVFEGSSLQNLKGLSEVTDYKGLKVFRPFLNTPKKDLLAWLEKQEIPYFLDPSNEDSRFLRSKMRKDIFPLLQKEFGKEVSKSLIRVGKNAAELSQFVEELVAPYRIRQKEEKGRKYLDFNPNPPKSPFLWKAVIRDFFDSLDLTFSDAVLETLVFHLQKASKNVCIRVAKRAVRIEGTLLSVSLVNDFK